MKKASIQLTRAHLKLLANSKPIIVNLPDAILEISIHPDAKILLSISRVLGETQEVIDKAKGKTCREPHR